MVTFLVQISVPRTRSEPLAEVVAGAEQRTSMQMDGKAARPKRPRATSVTRKAISPVYVRVLEAHLEKEVTKVDEVASNQEAETEVGKARLPRQSGYAKWP